MQAAVSESFRGDRHTGAMSVDTEGREPAVQPTVSAIALEPVDTKEDSRAALTGSLSVRGGSSERSGAHNESRESVAGACERFKKIIEEISSEQSVRAHFPDLISFGKSLSPDAAAEPVPLSISEEALRTQLESVPREQVRAAFAEALDRIHKRTQYFREFEALGIYENLRDGFRGSALGVSLRYTGGAQLEVDGIDKGVTAQYDHRKNEATIEGREPQTPALWARMASDGALPEQIEHIHHELVHSLQRVKTMGVAARFGIALGASIGVGITASVLGSPFLVQLPLQVGSYFLMRTALDVLFGRADRSAGSPAGRALRELQAYVATEESPTSARPPRSPQEHISHIAIQIGSEAALLAEVPPGPPGSIFVSPGRMIVAGMAVIGGGSQLTALRLLGVSHQEIGEAIRYAEFDPRTASFPMLDRLLEQRRTELGLEDDTVYTKLLRARGFQRAFENHEARRLACREAREALVQFGIEVTERPPVDQTANG